CARVDCSGGVCFPDFW
nr:immunoglobulin heavy chain junction region [Macaca mulatta]MOW84591.1 immunoglobulin heavy chain junction region [Macaca mulatta]MOW86146.1 immunoglobulin heavy chain junction region [Macaca mulatta]